MLFTLYSLACFFGPCLIYELLHLKKLIKTTYPIRHLFWLNIFLLYCYMVIDVTNIATIWDILDYRKIDGSINLIPFQSVDSIAFRLNIIMFMPLGFLLPLIWKSYRHCIKVLLIGFGFSLCIELLQLFCFRVTDIDDLITNTFGAFIGYIIWFISQKFFTKAGAKATMISKREPIFALSIGIAGFFLLNNWRLFY